MTAYSPHNAGLVLYENKLEMLLTYPLSVLLFVLRGSTKLPKENEMNTSNIVYEVVDIQTKAVIKQYPVDKGQAARNFANKRDLAYGAVRYVVRLV